MVVNQIRLAQSVIRSDCLTFKLFNFTLQLQLACDIVLRLSGPKADSMLAGQTLRRITAVLLNPWPMHTEAPNGEVAETDKNTTVQYPLKRLRLKLYIASQTQCIAMILRNSQKCNLMQTSSHGHSPHCRPINDAQQAMRSAHH